MAAKIFHAHPRVARDLDRAHPRLRAGDHVKGDIDELLLRVRASGWG